MIVNAYACYEPGSEFQPFEYNLGEIGKNDVDIQVVNCGLCYSDVSMWKNDWRRSTYPLVAGHEVVGRIIAKGSLVEHLQEGQLVGVGWNSGSCMSCDFCVSGQHNLCDDTKPTIVNRHGGFADRIRCNSTWAIPIPENMDVEVVGPLLCGGITVFQPLVQHKISPLSHVGVVGIGGLGHMALLFLKHWGCEITAFSTNPAKEQDARRLGAHHFINTHDKESLKTLRSRFDLIIDTVNVSLDWNSYLKTLKPNGILHIVGVADEVHAKIGLLLSYQRSITGSPTGSPATMRQMLEFANRHHIKPMVDVYNMSDINVAFAALLAGEARYRIVLSNSNHSAAV